MSSYQVYNSTFLDFNADIEWIILYVTDTFDQKECIIFFKDDVFYKLLIEPGSATLTGPLHTCEGRFVIYSFAKTPALKMSFILESINFFMSDLRGYPRDSPKFQEEITSDVFWNIPRTKTPIYLSEMNLKNLYR
jgi:hypothetical protein